MELIIAVAILIVAISGLLVTFVSCLLSNEAKSNLITVFNDAQYVLEEVKNLPFADIGSYTPPALNNLPNENITFTIPSSEFRIKTVTVEVSWTERGGNKNFQLSTRIAR